MIINTDIQQVEEGEIVMETTPKPCNELNNRLEDN